ncbi:putative spermidine/putrescine transport system permease protein [Pseudochelatococcus lubricantis]|uniref:Spermidine/putrescine transport system permease protein n=1 Tax=Pseudochelatococcus lubricantis TaxID=1538102 RepID=A0ABX0V316_9HYPH|nr:ABC transporter permease subunit [Pseudochelatococcus lubricantis]NIJ58210.1 putative spermidine/putrescine transport system permease protein [Pseudochelatococcus lubricantis]
MPRHIAALFFLPGTLVFVLFFALPATSILLEAASDAGSAVARVFADPVFWNGVRGSLLIGTIAPFVSLVVGVMVAIALSRLAPRLRTATLVAITLPLTFSGLIIAYGFILVFGRSGFVTLLLAELGFDPAVVGQFIYSVFGLGLAYSYYLIPRVVLVVLPAIMNFDATQIAAARSMGASRLRALAGIMLPQIAPSLAAAYALTASVAIGAYGTALALVGTQVNILPLVLYSKISETGTDMPAAAVISIVLMAICSAVIALAELMLGRR